MNIFNKPIRSEEDNEHNYINLGEMQVRSGWLEGNPQYPAMVLTCIHMANLIAGIEYLQQDASDKNLFKMAEMNKEVNEIVQGRKMYEPKLIEVLASEQPNSQWDLILQKVTGIFDTCYTRICHIKGFRLEIESEKKKEMVVEDLRAYSMKMEFKGNEKAEKVTSSTKPTKEEKEKELFRWIEGYPVRIFLTAENRKPYALYLQKVAKAKELLDYFEMKKSSSGFARHRQAIYRYAMNFKKNVVAAFAERIEQNANRVYRNPREVFIEETEQGDQAPDIPGQSKLPTNRKEPSISELSSLSKRFMRSTSIKFDVKKKQSRQQDYNGAEQPLSAMVRRRQISYTDPADVVRNSPVRKFNQVPDVIMEDMKLDSDQHRGDTDRSTELKLNLKMPRQEQKNKTQRGQQFHEIEFEEQSAKILSEREDEARIASSAKLDIRLQVKSLFMYVNHFEKVIHMELVQCMRSEIETSTESSVLYPVASYELDLQQSETNPQLYFPKGSHQLRFSSTTEDFECKFKLPTGQVQAYIQLETSTKYQKWSERPIYIKSVPFAGRLGVMFSRTELKPYNPLKTLDFLQQFMQKPNYDKKYLFIEQGRQKLQADELFKQRVWEMILNQNKENDELLEKQVFLGIPERFRESFHRLLTEGKDIPLATLTKMQFHQLKLAKQSLPQNIVDQLQQHLIVEDLLERLLKFECNRLLRARMHSVLLFCKYKHGQCKNVLYVFLYSLFRKLERVLLENCTSRQQLHRLFDTYYQVEHQLDELFSDLYNYL